VTPVRYEASDRRSDKQRQAAAANVVHRIHPMVQGVVLVVIVLLIALFFVGGVHRNNQVTRLRQHGVPVDVTVTSCLGVAAGSGSTASTFTCNGEFTLDGHRHNAVIGGVTTYRPAGQHLRGVSVPGDPALLSTAQSVAAERASTSVFIVPIILTVALIGLVLWVVLARRRHDIASDEATSASGSEHLTS
jgi:hypothetical protein